MERIGITGANGFVGRALTRAILGAGKWPVGIVREGVSIQPGFEAVQVASLDAITPGAFRNCTSVVHLAARVHVLHESTADPLTAFRAVNVDGALKTAEAALHAGARRFVFVSSIKALAELDPGRPLVENDVRNPPDPYGISKAEAEVMLQAFGARTGMEIVIARPPLVYGPEVRANFLNLMRVISRGTPLPLGSIQARRSMVYIDNLATALVACATHPRAANQLFHITDGEDPSVSELARRLGDYLHRPTRLVPVPPALLKALGRLIGKTAQIERLTGSLRVDSEHIRDVLGWRPSFSLDAGLAATAAWFLSSQANSTAPD